MVMALDNSNNGSITVVSIKQREICWFCTEYIERGEKKVILKAPSGNSISTHIDGCWEAIHYGVTKFFENVYHPVRHN